MAKDDFDSFSGRRDDNFWSSNSNFRQGFNQRQNLVDNNQKNSGNPFNSDVDPRPGKKMNNFGVMDKNEVNKNREAAKQQQRKAQSPPSPFEKEKKRSVKKTSQKKGRFPGGMEDWMITYSDTVTLILTFFVVMFSIMTFDQKKLEAVKESIDLELLKKKETNAIEVLLKELEQIIRKYDFQQNISISRDDFGVKLEFSSQSFYESGSAQIKEEMKPVLNSIAEMLSTLEFKDYIVEIEGHTDDVPINTLQYPSNWELSVHRATNVVHFFIINGINPLRMKAAGYADSKPKLPNKDANGVPIPSNREVNRRIVINIQRGNV